MGKGENSSDVRCYGEGKFPRLLEGGEGGGPLRLACPYIPEQSKTASVVSPTPPCRVLLEEPL